MNDNAWNGNEGGEIGENENGKGGKDWGVMGMGEKG